MWVLGGAGMKQVVEMVMNHDPMVPRHHLSTVDDRGRDFTWRHQTCATANRRS